MKVKCWPLVLFILSIFVGCGEDGPLTPELDVPDTYVSAVFESNVAHEFTILAELAAITAAANEAESNAPISAGIPTISYPANLFAATLPAYRTIVEQALAELTNAANSSTAFQNPGEGMPIDGEEGGLLGSRLLDENGLELEQMIQKGSFGAALYNHALSIVNGELSSASIDQLVAIFGATTAFSDEVSGSANYARRRSFNEIREGLYYDIEKNLITAKAALEAGDLFNGIRDEALDAFLLNWEKTNYATVIFYCNAAKSQLQEAGGEEGAQGDALHAYAEGVAFASGFRGIPEKMISDAQIESILELLLAPYGETPTSYQFLNDASLLANLDQVIEQIQTIYGFTDEEIASFYVNNPA